MSDPKAINKYIGGFFEIALPDGIADKSILSAWGVEAGQCTGFINARSALSALLEHLNAQRVLLPAYSCTSLLDACVGYDVVFYPLTDTLDPDIEFLGQFTKQGDVVLAINYFGRGPSNEFLEFVKQRKDIIFIEDCAQSLSTGIAPWGDWRLFSPRKLVGVADGGFVVPTDRNAKNMTVDFMSDVAVSSRWAASFLRLEDKEGAFNSLWHSSNQKYEQSMKVEDKKISYLSSYLLSKLDIESIILKRKNNYRTLSASLSSWAFLKNDNADYAPFGYPIRVPENQRDRLVEALIKDNIFPAVHWRDLPSPISDFKFEHQLSKELMTLPCDQRYGIKDMAYISASVQKFMTGIR